MGKEPWWQTSSSYLSNRPSCRGRHRGATVGTTFSTVWPLWFRRDGVHLREGPLPYLCGRLDPVLIHETSGHLPFRVPYLRFLGRRRR